MQCTTITCGVSFAAAAAAAAAIVMFVVLAAVVDLLATRDLTMQQ
jgi:hypothetical protein